MDQTAAFEWGYKFAPAFGGDTSQVTLNGCSAGSESVFWHMTIEESWPYFHRVSTVGVGLNAVNFINF
jgi:carboxylesterase type B